MIKILIRDCRSYVDQSNSSRGFQGDSQGCILDIGWGCLWFLYVLELWTDHPHMVSEISADKDTFYCSPIG